MGKQKRWNHISVCVCAACVWVCIKRLCGKKRVEAEQHSVTYSTLLWMHTRRGFDCFWTTTLTTNPNVNFNRSLFCTDIQTRSIHMYATAWHIEVDDLVGKHIIYSSLSFACAILRCFSNVFTHCAKRCTHAHMCAIAQKNGRIQYDEFSVR